MWGLILIPLQSATIFQQIIIDFLNFGLANQAWSQNAVCAVYFSLLLLDTITYYKILQCKERNQILNAMQNKVPYTWPYTCPQDKETNQIYEEIWFARGRTARWRAFILSSEESEIFLDDKASIAIWVIKDNFNTVRGQYRSTMSPSCTPPWGSYVVVFTILNHQPPLWMDIDM